MGNYGSRVSVDINWTCRLRACTNSESASQNVWKPNRPDPISVFTLACLSRYCLQLSTHCRLTEFRCVTFENAKSAIASFCNKTPKCLTFESCTFEHLKATIANFLRSSQNPLWCETYDFVNVISTIASFRQRPLNCGYCDFHIPKVSDSLLVLRRRNIEMRRFLRMLVLNYQ